MFLAKWDAAWGHAKENNEDFEKRVETLPALEITRSKKTN